MLPSAHPHVEHTRELEAATAGANRVEKTSEDWATDQSEEFSRNLLGVLAQFASPGALVSACRRVSDAGYSRWDAYSPFPIHGLDRIMRLKRSKVPWFVLIFGLAGAGAGMALQWWTSVIAYPLIVSGKPLFSWPAFVPIMFECGVLGGAVGAIAGFLISSRLPRHHHPVFESETFEKVTDNRFFVFIRSDDPEFKVGTVESLLTQLGAASVERI
ncbi:MAG TPA: DUF3341 domain-containing protein [Acidobacteriota bacterium]|nr:DUF3341 domain-containing protein [Acidobacteriota bacterium]